MSTSPERVNVPDDVRRALRAKAFLFDHPDDYLAGVEEAVKAMTPPRSRILVVEDGGREEWLRALEQYRVASGPPISRSARAFESKLERQLSA